SIQNSGICSTRTEYVSTTRTFTVYAAEFRGLVLTVQIVLDLQITPGKCAIFTDN
ncbi:hypothetical protein F5883DRAFT_430985, partial [Diaporthe sp. PMI_573]